MSEQLPPGLESMRRIAFDLSQLANRVDALEKWTSRFQGPTQGNAGDVLQNNGDGTASWVDPATL